MEHKLDFKMFVVIFLVGIGVLLGVMVIGAFVGTKLPSPQSAALPTAILSVLLASVVMGVLCARFLGASTIIHSILCALALTLIICLVSLGNEHNGSIFGTLIPVISLSVPPICAYFTTPKNNSKRKLKRLGVKI